MMGTCCVMPSRRATPAAAGSRTASGGKRTGDATAAPTHLHGKEKETGFECGRLWHVVWLSRELLAGKRTAAWSYSKLPPAESTVHSLLMQHADVRIGAQVTYRARMNRTSTHTCPAQRASPDGASERTGTSADGTR